MSYMTHRDRYPRTLKEMDEFAVAHGDCPQCGAEKGEVCMSKIQWGRQFGYTPEGKGFTTRVNVFTPASHAHSKRIQAWMSSLHSTDVIE
jgi:hypothetical protein